MFLVNQGDDVACTQEPILKQNPWPIDFFWLSNQPRPIIEVDIKNSQ
jgi:hypothetical protein